jgi:hypothetical protein
MNGFAKGRLDAEPLSDHRRRDSADQEIEQARQASFHMGITA